MLSLRGSMCPPGKAQPKATRATKVETSRGPAPGAEQWLLRTGTESQRGPASCFHNYSFVPPRLQSPICNSLSSCEHRWSVTSCSVSQKHGTISGHCRFFALLLGKQQFAGFLLDFSSLFRINFPFPLCGREMLKMLKQKSPCF